MATKTDKKKDAGEVVLFAKASGGGVKGVRLSFAHIFKPQPGFLNEDGTRGDPRYGCAFLIPKDDPDFRPLMAALKKAKDAKLTEAFGAGKEPTLKPDFYCVKDGDLEDREEYAGNWVVSSANPRPPVIVDKDGKTVLTEADRRPYSGCYGIPVIRLWVQKKSNEGGKLRPLRVNASLEAIQFYKHGEAFGAAPIDPTEVFRDLTDADDEDDVVIGGESEDDPL